MTNPRYKFNDTDSTLVSEIPIGVVSGNAWFVFDKPFIVPPKGELKLKNGEWFLITNEGPVMQSGMWKTSRT
jgi:hypothetical protein